MLTATICTQNSKNDTILWDIRRLKFPKGRMPMIRRRLQQQSVAGTASSRALIQFHIPGAGGSSHKKRAEPKPCPFQIQTVETVMNFSHLFYHLNLRPNLTVLAGAFPSVPRIFMKLEEVTLRLGLPKCGVFVALNISARNSVDSHSVTLN